MNVYLHLFHGRDKPDQKLDDWGADGPVLGPLSFVHTTYGALMHLGGANGDTIRDVPIHEGLVVYGGVYYGDWSVFSEEVYLKAWRKGEMNAAVMPTSDEPLNIVSREGDGTAPEWVCLCGTVRFVHDGPDCGREVATPDALIIHLQGLSDLVEAGGELQDMSRDEALGVLLDAREAANAARSIIAQVKAKGDA